MEKVNMMNNPFIEMFKMFSENNPMICKMPMIDLQHIINMQRSNMETINSINQVMAEGMQAMMKRQVEIVNNNASQALQMAKEISTAQNFESGASKMTHIIKNGFEHMAENVKEITDMGIKSGMEVFDMISKRVSENISESVAANNSSKKRSAA